MNVDDLKSIVKEIVKQATILKDKYIEYKEVPVNYACIFSQSKEEYQELLEVTNVIGETIKETPTGPLFKINALDTISGSLKLLKIRLPDPTRLERGDADFTIDNFKEFEDKYMSKPQFKRMDKPDFYMIELMDSDFDVRAYFSNPPLDKQLNLS